MKQLILPILLLFFLPLTLAELQIEDTFGDLTPLLPPTPTPQEQAKIELTLKDFITKDPVSDIHILVSEQGSENSNLIYVDEKGILKLDLDPGNHQIELRGDLITTSGTDFYGSHTLSIQSRNDLLQDTVFLLPVGSIRGIVHDKTGNVYPESTINVECSGDYGNTEEIVADAYGLFSLHYLAIGSCRISALANDRVGYIDVEVQQGGLENIELILDKGFIAFNWFNFFGMIAFLILIVFSLYLAKSHGDEASKPEISTTPQRPSRQEDLKKTLSERELQVVEYLQEQDGISTQGKIRKATRIPKTTLIRIFQRLEQKKIIQVETDGKLKEIKFTDWFLEKE
ncbi:hypothetical protein CMO92_00050 [Candidatus Woesearchaeota archaeon]|nr:hypothetical protein [Candidatus Woesearchaeota archaeon]|tara:strand:- start:332 stop:1357 length:1026 start_codon:yes stop_codon:yes gene_type:complete